MLKSNILYIPKTYTNTNFHKKVLRLALKEYKRYMPNLEFIPKKGDVMKLS